jgi:hypothetical protein
MSRDDVQQSSIAAFGAVTNHHISSIRPMRLQPNVRQDAPWGGVRSDRSSAAVLAADRRDLDDPAIDDGRRSGDSPEMSRHA